MISFLILQNEGQSKYVDQYSNLLEGLAYFWVNEKPGIIVFIGRKEHHDDTPKLEKNNGKADEN